MKKERAPEFLIRRNCEHGWDVLRLNRAGDCYDIPYPAAGHLKNEAEAMETMLALVQKRRPDYSKFEPYLGDIRRYYDIDGNLVEDASEK